METTVSKPKKSSKSGLIVIGIFVAAFLVFGGESSKLTCKHSRQPGTATCVKKSVLLWVIPLSTKSINEVSGAQLSATTGYEDSDVYRVELITPQGIAPLTSAYTSGYSTKRDLVEQVNTFLQSTGNETLVANEPGMLSLENLLCTAIWLPIAYLGSLIWGQVKGVFSGAKNR